MGKRVVVARRWGLSTLSQHPGNSDRRGDWQSGLGGSSRWTRRLRGAPLPRHGSDSPWAQSGMSIATGGCQPGSKSGAVQLARCWGQRNASSLECTGLGAAVGVWEAFGVRGGTPGLLLGGGRVSQGEQCKAWRMRTTWPEDRGRKGSRAEALPGQRLGHEAGTAQCTMRAVHDGTDVAGRERWQEPVCGDFWAGEEVWGFVL